MDQGLHGCLGREEGTVTAGVRPGVPSLPRCCPSPACASAAGDRAQSVGTGVVAAFTQPLAITSAWDHKAGQLQVSSVPASALPAPAFTRVAFWPSWAGPGRAGEGRSPPTVQGRTAAGLRSRFSRQQTSLPPGQSRPPCPRAARPGRGGAQEAGQSPAKPGDGYGSR